MPGPDIHADSLVTSTTITEWYIPKMISAWDVFRVLNTAGVRFLLVGSHSIGGWLREPRAAEDIDILPSTRGFKNALRTLLVAFPRLKAVEEELEIRLRDSETSFHLIDLIKPKLPLLRAASKHSRSVPASPAYRIPSLEMALAMKFAAMTSPLRYQADMYLDAHDFILMVKTNPDIDLETLAELGQLVYNGGGAEIVEKVRQVRAGERMNL